MSKLFGDLYGELGVSPKDIPQKVYEEFGPEIKNDLLNAKEPNEIVRDIADREWYELREEIGLEREIEETENIMRWPKEEPVVKYEDPSEIEKQYSE